jgi:hypothetical protein
VVVQIFLIIKVKVMKPNKNEACKFIIPKARVKHWIQKQFFQRIDDSAKTTIS